MTFERHRVLSATCVDAVERADAERTWYMRRFLFWWWPPWGKGREQLGQGLESSKILGRRPETELGSESAVEGQRWCDSTERHFVRELTGEHQRPFGA